MLYSSSLSTREITIHTNCCTLTSNKMYFKRIAEYYSTDAIFTILTPFLKDKNIYDALTNVCTKCCLHIKPNTLYFWFFVNQLTECNTIPSVDTASLNSIGVTMMCFIFLDCFGQFLINQLKIQLGLQSNIYYTKCVYTKYCKQLPNNKSQNVIVLRNSILLLFRK